MPDEPNLSNVHADLVGRFEHDKRLRYVEVSHAETSAAVSALKGEVAAVRADQKEDKAEILAAIRDSKAETTAAIKANKPEKPDTWRAVSALAGVMGVLVIVFAAIYGQ